MAFFANDPRARLAEYMTEDFMDKHIRLFDERPGYQISQEMLRERQAEGHELPSTFVDLRSKPHFDAFLAELIQHSQYAVAHPEKFVMFQEERSYKWISVTKLELVTAAKAEGAGFILTIGESKHVECCLRMDQGIAKLKHINFKPDVEQDTFA
eukprot:TRINITY_DN93601_c0_g1_i1.p1 TRINITY_DN93601_c0_g1~~TRINITY_DN93601_c0_g1_i1.p1  ORF type:complete len:154 (-),score=28.61 TRINITY_DN93601_c0_g1_i1:133-594(-)